MNKSEAGRKGGLKTLEKYGREYLSEIGRRGAAALWEKYQLVPVNMTEFAIVDRKTGKIVARHS